MPKSKTPITPALITNEGSDSETTESSDTSDTSVDTSDTSVDFITSTPRRTEQTASQTESTDEEEISETNKTRSEKSTQTDVHILMTTQQNLLALHAAVVKLTGGKGLSPAAQKAYQSLHENIQAQNNLIAAQEQEIITLKTVLKELRKNTNTSNTVDQERNRREQPERAETPQKLEAVLQRAKEETAKQITYTKTTTDANKAVEHILIKRGLNAAISNVKTGPKTTVLTCKDQSNARTVEKCLMETTELEGVIEVKKPRVPSATIQIRDVASTITHQEFMAALSQRFGLDTEITYVKSIRLTDDLNTWKITLPKPLAEKLLEKQHMYLGLKKCPIKTYIHVFRCNRCQYLDGSCTAAACHGTQTCAKCAGTGHDAAACQAIRPKCVNCLAYNSRLPRNEKMQRNTDHPASAYYCPTYKAVVKNKINQHRTPRTSPTNTYQQRMQAGQITYASAARRGTTSADHQQRKQDPQRRQGNTVTPREAGKASEGPRQQRRWKRKPLLPAPQVSQFFPPNYPQQQRANNTRRNTWRNGGSWPGFTSQAQMMNADFNAFMHYMGQRYGGQYPR